MGSTLHSAGVSGDHSSLSQSCGRLRLGRSCWRSVGPGALSQNCLVVVAVELQVFYGAVQFRVTLQGLGDGRHDVLVVFLEEQIYDEAAGAAPFDPEWVPLFAVLWVRPGDADSQLRLVGADAVLLAVNRLLTGQVG